MKKLITTLCLSTACFLANNAQAADPSDTTVQELEEVTVTSSSIKQAISDSAKPESSDNVSG